MSVTVPARPRKRFGQHFLVDAGVARRIVALAQLSGRETVLEIGPGRGALTRLLVRAAARLYLIEIDRDLSQRLREELVALPTVQVVEGDVLDINLQALLPPDRPVVAVANLPYNISTPVLMQLLETPERFARLVLMVQREVAERLCAAPGSKAYGALSVMAQLVAAMRIALRVPPAAFSPRPKVQSAVVVFEPHRDDRVSDAERHAVRRVVRTVFTRRRKQLGNALTPLTAHPHAVLRDLGVDPRRRPETLTVDEFVRIARALSEERDG